MLPIRDSARQQEKTKRTEQADESGPSDQKDSKSKSNDKILNELKTYLKDETDCWQEMCEEAKQFDDPAGKYMTYLKENGFTVTQRNENTDINYDTDFDPGDIHFADHTEYEQLTGKDKCEKKEWTRIQLETTDLKLKLGDDFFEPDGIADGVDSSFVTKLEMEKSPMTTKIINEFKSKMKEEIGRSSAPASVGSPASLEHLSSETDIQSDSDGDCEEIPPQKTEKHTTAKSERGEQRKNFPANQKGAIVVDLVDLTDDDKDNDLEIINDRSSSPELGGGSQSSLSQQPVQLSDSTLQQLIRKRAELLELVTETYKYSQKVKDNRSKMKAYKKDSEEIPAVGPLFIPDEDEKLQSLLDHVDEMIKHENAKKSQSSNKLN